MKSFNSSGKLFFSVLAIATLLALPAAQAATKIWNQAGGGDFNTLGNWTAAGVPVAADTGLFNIALSGNVTLSANATPGSLSFDTNASTFSLGALAGNTITTANLGSISVLSTLTGTGKTFTINAPLVLTPASTTTAGSYTIQNNATDATNTLVIAGGITSSTTSNTETLTIGGTNTGANTVSGVIGNGSATTFAVTKSGAGTWVLSGNNTYTGLTTVSAGTLRLSGNNTSATGGLTLTAGTVDLRSTTALGTGTLALTPTLNGGGILVNGSGTALTMANVMPVTLAGVNFGAAGDTGGNGDITFGTGAVSYSGVFTETLLGTGSTFRFNGAVTNTGGNSLYTVNGAGNTLVFGSSLVSANGAAVNTGTTFLGSANITILGAVANGAGANGATTQLAYGGTGTLTLNGANTYTGTTTVSGGNLTLSGANGAINTSSVVNISGGGTLKLDNTSAANNTDRLKDAGTVTLSGGTTFNFSNNAGAANYSETTGALTIAAGANTITASQAAVGQTSALTFASFSRTGGVVNFAGTGLGANDRNRILFTANPVSNGIILGATYGGVDFASYDVTNGVIQLATHTDINALGSTIANGSTTNVRINAVGSGGDVALGAVTTAVNSLLQNTTTAATVATAGKTLRTTAIMVGSGQQSVTIGAAAGDGTLTAATAGGALSLINSSSNNLTINAAIANFTSASSLNTVGNVILNALPTYTGTTSIGAGSLTLGFNSNQAISAIISGDGALVKEGTGTLTLSALNTFSGGLTINNGSVATTGNQNTVLGNGPVSFGSGSNNVILSFTGVPSSPTTNTFAVASGAGTRTITSSATGGGPTLGGAFSLSKDLILSSTGGSTGIITLSNTISQTTTAGLIIDATNLGIINLRGNSTFSGGIAINSGTLQGQNAASVGTVGALTSGALGTGTVTLGATSSASSAAIDFPLAYAFGNALIVTSGGTRTISASGATQTVEAWNGGIALSNDLNLTAVATTNITGLNRLNIGNGSVGGGITGSNNIIISNANTATGAVASSGAINLAGGSTATAWTGNLIVQGGQGSISAVNAIGASNTVGVTSGAIFNFSNTNAIDPTIAGLSNSTASALGGSTGGTVLHTQATDRTLTLGGSGNYSFAGVIANAINGTNKTALTVALTGAGSQTLSGTNTYTGNTAVNAGTLQFAKQVALYNNGAAAAWSNANINVNSGATMAFNIGGSGEFTKANIIALLGLSNGANGFKTGSILGLDTTSGDFLYDSVIANTNSGTNVLGLTKLGTSKLTLDQANTFTGLTTVSNGILEVNANQALGTTAAGTTVASGAALKLNAVNYATAEALAINGTGVSNGGALVNAGTSTYAGAVTATTNSTINTGGGTVTFTGGLVKNGTVLTLTGGGTVNVNTTAISGSSANSDLVVDGTTANLNTANTYNGPTYIRNGGTINATVANALPTSNGRTALVMDDSGSGSSNLTLTNTVQAVASLTGAASSTVNLNANALTIGATSGTTTFAGVISGTNGSLVKDNSSTQILSGINTYTGDTTITAGTLILADNAGLKFAISGNGVNNKITGAGTVTLDGDFTFDLATAGTTVGNSWTIANASTQTFSSTFTVVGFTDNLDNTWSTVNLGTTYKFSELSGVLSVVPEPATWALLAFSLTTVMVLRRRRRA